MVIIASHLFFLLFTNNRQRRARADERERERHTDKTDTTSLIRETQGAGILGTFQIVSCQRNPSVYVLMRGYIWDM